jgi:hypothetical protein
MLAVPAIRLSHCLKEIKGLLETHEAAERRGPAEKLAKIMENQARIWNKWDHWLLLGGVIFLCLSFLVGLIFPETGPGIAN